MCTRSARYALFNLVRCGNKRQRGWTWHRSCFSIASYFKNCCLCKQKSESVLGSLCAPRGNHTPRCAFWFLLFLSRTKTWGWNPILTSNFCARPFLWRKKTKKQTFLVSKTFSFWANNLWQFSAEGHIFSFLLKILPNSEFFVIFFVCLLFCVCYYHFYY